MHKLVNSDMSFNEAFKASGAPDVYMKIYIEKENLRKLHQERLLEHQTMEKRVIQKGLDEEADIDLAILDKKVALLAAMISIADKVIAKSGRLTPLGRCLECADFSFEAASETVRTPCKFT